MQPAEPPSVPDDAAAGRCEHAAAQLADVLRAKSVRVVLAESCTAGHAAATLGAIPGISEFFCGSVVAYRDQTKIDLLGVSPAAIDQWTSVSEEVAAQMAKNVLRRVGEADYAASITGHLGPDAPRGQDGLVFIGLARRENNQPALYRVAKRQLAATTRPARRAEATTLVFELLAEAILAPPNEH